MNLNIEDRNSQQTTEEESTPVENQESQQGENHETQQQNDKGRAAFKL